MKFYGHILTNKGLQADPSKNDAIVEMPPPPDVKSLQSFLALFNYTARFQPSLSIVSRPLHDLMKEHVDNGWSTEADKAFNDIKWSITQTPILQSFDPKKETIIQSDASMNALGCTLIHDEKPVCYASRALTETESRYSNIGRELLAAMWYLEHFNHYIEENHAVLQTYHKPLVSIWMKPIHTASPRIQCLLRRMSLYNVKLEYIQGKTNVIADALSLGRVLPCTTTTSIHGILQQLPMCYLLLDPTCSLQIMEEVIVETGVIYVLSPNDTTTCHYSIYTFTSHTSTTH